jgi:hypothetical protein
MPRRLRVTGGQGTEGTEQITDRVVFLERVTQRAIGVEAVAVAAPFPPTRDVPGGDEVVEDGLRCAVCDAHRSGDLAHPRLRIPGEEDDRMAVIREKGPGDDRTVNEVS